MRVLDRVAQFDERSRQYRAVAGIEDKPLRSYTWKCDTWNDQGNEGACVGFSWSHELAARPVVIPTDNDYARKIYNRAKQLDDQPGENYEGTSVLAGAKAVAEIKGSKDLSIMDEYRWAFGVDDLMLAVGRKGPAVIGINWYSDMWDVDANGFVHKSGNIVGGHAILVRGIKIVLKDPNGPKAVDNVDRDKSYFVLRNSWGQSWGVNGDCRVTVTDMGALLSEQGDACIPVHRHK